MNADPRRYPTLLAALAVAAPLWAEEPPTAKPPEKPAPAVESNKPEPSLDELLNLPKKPGKPAEKPPVGKIADEESSEPFSLAVEGMKRASDRLSEKSDAGIETQRLQEQAVTRLDGIIADLKSRMKPQKSQARKQDKGSQQKQEQQEQQEQPGEPSPNPAGQGTRQPLVKNPQAGDQPLKEELVEWGNLPPRLRDQLRQSREERFSDLYKLLTQQYYRRLAEESQP